MAKNSRKKKNKKKRPMSRDEFIGNVCESCMICGSMTGALFCYDVMYKLNPAVFMKHSYHFITALDTWSLDPDETSSYENLESFESIFCESQACKVDTFGINCNNVNNCLDAFITQIIDSYDEDDELVEADCSGTAWHKTMDQYFPKGKNNKTKGKKGKKGKKKPVPTPTFFCNDPAKWAVRIERLHGNNNSKQNKTQRGSE